MQNTKSPASRNTTNEHATIRRESCQTCRYPARSCICNCIAHVANPTPVLILQHPQEVNEAKGTGRLLHLCLENSMLATGETFDAAALQTLIDNFPGKRPVLLYPDLPSLPCCPAEPHSIDNSSGTLLIVIDATWRKSRKMLFLSPALQSLPRLSLQDIPASGYTIRKAHKEGQLSTLEATCHALAAIDHDTAHYHRVTDAFQQFITLRRTFLPQK